MRYFREVLFARGNAVRLKLMFYFVTFCYTVLYMTVFPLVTCQRKICSGKWENWLRWWCPSQMYFYASPPLKVTGQSMVRSIRRSMCLFHAQT